MAGFIQTTLVVYAMMQHEFVFERRGFVAIKGKGEVVTYVVLGRREAGSVQSSSPATRLTDLVRRAQDDLDDLVLVDSTTKLPTSRALVLWFRQAKRNAHREKHRLLVMVAKLSNLRDINGTNGITGGDEALFRCAQVLQGAFRASDIVARVGSNYFCIVGREIEPTPEGLIEGRISRLVNAHNEGLGDEPALDVVMTLGVLDTSESLMACLDELERQIP